VHREWLLNFYDYKFIVQLYSHSPSQDGNYDILLPSYILLTITADGMMMMKIQQLPANIMHGICYSHKSERHNHSMKMKVLLSTNWIISNKKVETGIVACTASISSLLLLS
jgi:hypothetical protein